MRRARFLAFVSLFRLSLRWINTAQLCLSDGIQQKSCDEYNMKGLAQHTIYKYASKNRTTCEMLWSETRINLCAYLNSSSSITSSAVPLTSGNEGRFSRLSRTVTWCTEAIVKRRTLRKPLLVLCRKRLHGRTFTFCWQRRMAPRRALQSARDEQWYGMTVHFRQYPFPG